MLEEVGSKREFDFPIRNHVDIGESLDLVDFDTASDVSGSKFYYLKREAAMLELALINYTMAKLVNKYGFTPYMTPDLVRESVFEKCGFQPRADNTQARATCRVMMPGAGRCGRTPGPRRLPTAARRRCTACAIATCA